MVHLGKWFFLQSTHKMNLKITVVKFLPHLPGASELTGDLKQPANRYVDLRVGLWILQKKTLIINTWRKF